MERSCTPHEGTAQCAQVPAPAGHDDREFLGQSPATRDSQIHPQGQENESRPSGPVSTGNVLRLLEYQKHRCALTGRTLEPNTASLDHIMPVRSGGEHSIQNTQVLHKDVNKAKTTMTNDEFIQLCLEVVQHSSLSHHSVFQTLIRAKEISDVITAK